MAGKSSRLAILLDLDGSKFEKGLNRSMSRFKSASKSMQTAGRNLSMGLSAPLAVVGASSFKVAADFEMAMAKVGAVSGGGAKSLDALTQQAKHLGGTTSFSASQVSELQLELSKLGFTQAQLTGGDGIPGMTNSVLNLSKAFDQELGETATVVGATLRQFGLESKDTGRVTDVMAASFAGSALDLTKFSESMKNVAPVANEFGFSLEETSALIGVLANNGIAGSDAGTKLKMAFSELAKSGVPVKDTFTKLIEGGTGYTEAMNMLGTRAAILGPVFGKNLKDLGELNAAFVESEGTAQSMSDAMGNTTAGKLAEMQSAIEAAQIELGTALAPAILEVVTVIRDMASAFANLDEGTRETIVKFGMAVAALGPMLIVGGKVTGALGSISKGFKLFQGAAALAGTSAATSFSGLAAVLVSGPFLAVTAAVVGLGLALRPVIKRMSSLEFKSRSMAGATKEMNKAIATERAEVTTLFSKLKLAAKGERDRSDAVKDINSQYGEYLGNLDLNTASLEDIEKAELAVRDAVAARVRAQLLADTTKKQGEAQATVEKILLDFEVEALEDGGNVDEIVKVSNEVRNLFSELAAGNIDVSQFKTSLSQIKDAAGRDLAYALRTATDSGGVFGTGLAGAAVALNDAATATRNFQAIVDRLDGTQTEAAETKEDETKAEEASTDAKKKSTSATKTQTDETKTLADVVAGLAGELAKTAKTENVFGETFGKRDADRVSDLNKAIADIVGGVSGDVDVSALKLTTEQISALQSVLGEDFGGDADSVLAALAEAVKTLGAETVTTTEGPLESLRAKMSELKVLEGAGLLSSMDAAHEALTALDQALQDSVLADPDFINTDKFKEMTEAADTLRKGLEKVGDQQESNKEKFDAAAEAQQAATDLAGAAVDAMFDKNQKLGESMVEATKSIVKGLIKQALATAISNAVASAFSPASPDNVVTGGAAAPAKAAGLMAAVKSLFSSIPAFAEGGAVLGGRGGTLALIGEKPSSRGEFIVPFEKMGRFIDMAGGQNGGDIHTRIHGNTLEISNRRAGRGVSRRSVL
jgi:hypothetical protein